MGLRTKFNLAILAAFVLGFLATAFLLNRNFVAAARQQVIAKARVMLSEADAVRDYTVKQVEPVTGTERAGKFIVVSVPSFAAQFTFHGLSSDFPGYAYKEAALNPTNPADRATDWEADIINAFRQGAALQEIVTDRETPMGAAYPRAAAHRGRRRLLGMPQHCIGGSRRNARVLWKRQWIRLETS